MNLFLASSINIVGKDIARKVDSLFKNKHLLFISTASEGEKGDLSWVDEDRKSLEHSGLLVEQYSVTGKNQGDIAEKLKTVGSICVGGGNTYYLLYQARKSGFDRVIKEFVKNGLVYIGASAGSLLAGPTIETSLDDPSVHPEMTDYTGLGLTDICVRPHWGSREFQKRYQQEMDRLYSLNQPMILLTDNQYLHVRDDWYQVISVT